MGKLLVCAAALLAALLASAHAGPTLAVGSKRFTESYILAEIIAHSAGAAGEARVVHKPGLGNTAIVFSALRSGAIDLYPEYTGTIDREILKSAGPLDAETRRRRLAQVGIGLGVPLGFNNTYALAMDGERAAALGIATLSDLARHPALRLGLSQEFIGRSDGWEGLKKAYGLPFATPRGLDHGLAYEALAAGQVDVIDAYSTDAKIEKYRLRVLVDDRNYFPRYDAVILHRLDLPQRLPGTWAALGALEGTISADRMVALNAEAELGGKTFAAVAENFLRGRGVAGAGQAGFWSRLFGPDFLRLTGDHLTLVFVSLALAIAAGLPLGITAERTAALRQPILAVTGLVQTIPSLALLAFLIPLFGTIGAAPALAALFLYSLLPIVRNTYTGLAEIPRGMIQAALALGFTSGAVLRLIELPLAARTILAGIKTAAVINVGTATIAAFVGAGGYGERIAQGLALNDNGALLAGAVPAAALALLVHGAFELLDRWLVPAGVDLAGAGLQHGS
jgi:osmoprotectant transport system permease protein